jgi:hypothetical protein
VSRLRSATVIALLLLAALAASSAPDGFGGPARRVARVTGTVALSAEPGPADGSRSGKRWAVRAEPAGPSVDPNDGRGGKRWS